MARRRLEGLERVLGVNALSTAYGNVGSSLDYALGRVASFVPSRTSSTSVSGDSATNA